MYGLIFTIVIISAIYFSRQDRKKERLNKIQQERRASTKREHDNFINGIYTTTNGKKVYIDNGRVTISGN